MKWSFARLGVLWCALWLALSVQLAWAAGAATVARQDLPPEARETLARIEAGGPFKYRQDGVVFGNRERHLPQKPRGYYREYTVTTPGARDRGARRIVAGGGQASREYWYTADHYNSFIRIAD
jgi:ribonuclease T1